jgi:hypothetical protein
MSLWRVDTEDEHEEEGRTGMAARWEEDEDAGLGRGIGIFWSS